MPALIENPALEELAVRQHGLVTRAQILSFSIDDMAMCRRTKAGVWQRVLPAVYLTNSGSITPEQRRVAAALYAGASAQITGLSALDWYGFRYLPPSDNIFVLLPHDQRRKSTGFVRVQRTHDLDASAHLGDLYAVCSPPRAVVDACRELRELRAVRAIVAESIQRGFCRLGRLDHEIRRAGRSRTALVRLAFEEVAHGVRSAPEGDLRAVLNRSKILPPAMWNPILHAPDGTRLCSPDGWLAEVGIALEVDSREYHFSPDGWRQTLERHNELGQYGIVVLHFTPAQIRDSPASVLVTCERTYTARKEAGVNVLVHAR